MLERPDSHSGERRVCSAMTGDLNTQNNISELLEVVAAVVVTAGQVAGNLLLFSPLQVDNRIKAPGTPTEPGTPARTVFW